MGMPRAFRHSSSTDTMFSSIRDDPYSKMEGGGLEAQGDFYEKEVRHGFMSKVFGELLAALIRHVF